MSKGAWRLDQGERTQTFTYPDASYFLPFLVIFLRILWCLCTFPTFHYASVLLIWSNYLPRYFNFIKCLRTCLPSSLQMDLLPTSGQPPRPSAAGASTSGPDRERVWVSQALGSPSGETGGYGTGVAGSCEGGTAPHFISLLSYPKRCRGTQPKQRVPAPAPAGSPGAPAPLCA